MKPSSSTHLPLVSLSVVSHGQGHLIESLLRDMRHWTGAHMQIIVTFNIPEDKTFLKQFEDLDIEVISNVSAKGFGANHNDALSHAKGDTFIVVNPDIRANELDFGPLLETVTVTDVGACAPLVLSNEGKIEDSARRFPTLARLATRVILKIRSVDFDISTQPVAVDWVAGMFVAFRADVFRSIGGFDTRYFMYMEDADICRRLHRRHLRVIVDPRCKVVHEARRASRKDAQHMRWHVRSALRFLFHI